MEPVKHCGILLGVALLFTSHAGLADTDEMGQPLKTVPDTTLLIDAPKQKKTARNKKRSKPAKTQNADPKKAEKAPAQASGDASRPNR